MAIETVEQKLIPDLAQERVVLMDAFGSEHEVYIPISKSAQRADILAAEGTILQANEDALRAYALEHYGQDQLDAMLAAGAALIAARKAK